MTTIIIAAWLVTLTFFVFLVGHSVRRNLVMITGILELLRDAAETLRDE